MWGWIAQGLRPAAGAAARVFPAVVLMAVAGTVSPGVASAAPVVFEVPGGKVRILDMPRRDRHIRDIVVLTVSEELANQKAQPLGTIDPARCPTGEVLITIEKQATLERKWAEVSSERAALGALLVRGAPCRIWLNARAFHRLDDARICNVVRHELGHARGLDHATSGLMVPAVPILPVNGCEWAESDWLSDES